MEDRKGFMSLAIALAAENVSKTNGGPFGAVIVKDGEVLGRGINKVTSTHDPTAHAEVVAIREACATLSSFDLSGCEIYTSCEPCPMCLGAIYWAKIEKLFYGATKDDAAKAKFIDAELYEQFRLPKDQRTIASVQMMRDEALKVFDQWNSTDDKIHY